MRRLAVLGVAALALGCPDGKDGADAGAPDAGPVALTEKEPNNAHAQALPIGGSSAVSGGISVDPSKADEDWYLLQAPGRPQTVDLTLSGIPAADVAVELYDQDQNALVAVNSEG